MIASRPMVPEELRLSPRWMAWFRSADGRKVPLDAKTGRGAPGYHDDPAAWSSFEQLAKRIPKPSKERGWGFVVGAPYVAVDIDDCLNHGAPDRRAQLILQQIPSTYAELSPSGKGLHLWYKCAEHGRLPQQAIGSFEAYARRRFMTVTGVGGQQPPIRELPYQDALEVFRLANPASVEAAPKTDGEEGWWTPAALEACLSAWAAGIPSFKYGDRAGRWAVPCPRYALHSEKRGELTRDAQCWVEGGWAVFHCFHAHCAGLGWRGFAEHYDPFRDLFDFDAWQEEQLGRLDAED